MMPGTRKAISLLQVSLFVFNVVESADSNNQEAVFHLEKGHALVNHVIKTTMTHDAIDCSSECLRTHLCKSVNYQHGNSKNHQCQLNSKSKDSAANVDYQANSGFTYYEKNPCVPNPCSYAGTCLKVNSAEEFNCTCLQGFKGRLCDSERFGWFSRNPASSCKAILDASDGIHDGEYWIDPGNQGSPMRVFCDMTSSGGGWLLVSNAVIQSSSQSPPKTLTTSFRDISNYNNNQTLISSTNLLQLLQLMPFTQLRFQCRKSSIGRTVHIITTNTSSGIAVLNYMTAQTNNLPVACGSFTRGSGDNSQLASQCSRWGNTRTAVNVWGHASRKTEWRMYDHVMYIAGASHYIVVPSGYRCDANSATISPGDYWKMYVR
ncbi:uncharacterized protein LOC116301674 [Actinia tenebrosa]|uniref:Uncharacterized protein LOC116301674 n=1 Tax=Actinia tenebrosa TaxID=6105 RepID=A0A6P8IIW5_ACTTE|nr:uncharacterized protein LOC116301674 [Actinia tenebrosa]